MNKGVKAILIIGVIIFALSIGNFSGTQMKDYRAQTRNKTTTDTSNTELIGTTLDLSGQQLTELPASVISRTDVTILNISNNQLTSLPAGIAEMSNLVELNAENNRLEFLSPDISRLKNLRKLRVDNNRIMNLPPELTKMIWLHQLDISNNRLTSSEQENVKSKLNNVQVRT